MHEASFTAVEYSFDGPQSIPGGTTRIELVNDGEKQHDLLLFRLDEGKTLQDVIDDFQANAAAAVAAGPPEWITAYGGLAAVKPGERRNYVVDLEPGNYGMLSLGELLIGASDIPDVAHGMLAALTVTEGDAVTAPAPEANVTVDMLDFSFALSGPIAAGEQVIRVTNSGEELHELFIYRMQPGASLADFMAFFNDSPPSGPLAAELVGGLTLLDPGLGAILTMAFEPGVYVLACLTASTAHPGHTHLALGMVEEITVE
jgi:uncharacterized cupredoxin-like copper-binding protein